MFCIFLVESNIWRWHMGYGLASAPDLGSLGALRRSHRGERVALLLCLRCSTSGLLFSSYVWYALNRPHPEAMR